jgi:3',5'-cyclic AMP phosphodiesterase CpdA
MGAFRWLHLSDLHVGMSDQDWLWPTLKHALYDDMQALLASAGPWNLVIFSGDLTQRGTLDEFEKLNSILLEMWERFRSWGL